MCSLSKKVMLISREVIERARQRRTDRSADGSADTVLLALVYTSIDNGIVDITPASITSHFSSAAVSSSLL